MNKPQAPEPSKFAEPGARQDRRPYHKPRIVHQEALEAVAADCSVAGGKGDPTCIVGFS